MEAVCRMVGHEPEGQGPIIIAIDESGSMTTDYGGMTGQVWSKAVMLALLSIARLQIFVGVFLDCS